MRKVPTGHVSKFSDEIILKAYEELGPREAARQLGFSSPGAIANRVKRIKKRGCTRAQHDAKVTDKANEAVNRIQQLLDEASVKAQSIGSIKKVRLNSWGAGGFNKDRKWEEHGLFGTSIDITPKTPTFPFIVPAAVPPKIVHAQAPRIARKVKYAVILADAQIGFLRNPKTLALTPTHDPRALEVMRQVIADTAPSVGVGIGDWMDWPVFSRYTQHPEYFATCNLSIQAGHDWKAKMIAAAPQRCVWTEVGSNHQIRPEKFVLEHNMFAAGVERARVKDQDFQDEWGVFSEAFLLRYQALGIKMAAAWPGGAFEFIPGCMAMHAPGKVREWDCDVFYGHIHTLEMGTHVIHRAAGRKTHLYHSVGCLCSVSANPDKKSIHASLVPAFSSRNQWAQGSMIVEYIEGKAPRHQAHEIHIQDGMGLFMGKVYDGTKVKAA